MMLTAKDWLEKIRALPLARRVRIMNVCGGHERSITMAGLRGFRVAVCWQRQGRFDALRCAA